MGIKIEWNKLEIFSTHKSWTILCNTPPAVYSSQKRLCITLISWVRFVVWFIKFGTKTILNNSVTTTIGDTNPRQVSIFDFVSSTNLLYIQFSTFCHSNFSCPPMFKWIILFEKIGRSFKWFPPESHRVSRSNKHFKHSIITVCYHVMYEFLSESTLNSLPECQGTPWLKQMPCLKLRDSNVIWTHNQLCHEFLDIQENCRMWIHSETRTWHDNNIPSNAPYR